MMAIYQLSEFQSLVASNRWAFLNNTRPKKHLNILGWDNNNLAEILCRLEANDFRKTFKNQIVNNLPGVNTIDADHYVVNWDIDNWVRRSHQWVQGHPISPSIIELSIKIAIVETSNGSLAGLVTFHDSMSYN